ncbi:hypothetical protein [Aquibacillus albus]|uniref:Uncharacterized protein n=1 Tax=Aquibacillus albus TaxID=1168171 RepID=A0ABS2N0Q5_9BACI|nr:hypothetical protein [Aquibacillus albus]MBM7571694.1 hypothetical protein [Aquibacillus albus]
MWDDLQDDISETTIHILNELVTRHDEVNRLRNLYNSYSVITSTIILLITLSLVCLYLFFTYFTSLVKGFSDLNNFMIITLVLFGIVYLPFLMYSIRVSEKERRKKKLIDASARYNELRVEVIELLNI